MTGERTMVERSVRYRPSNGTEGEIFYERVCARCKRDAAHRRNPNANGCSILVRALAFNIDDPKYPKQWIEDAEGYGTCTAFRPDVPRARSTARKITSMAELRAWRARERDPAPVSDTQEEGR